MPLSLVATKGSTAGEAQSAITLGYASVLVGVMPIAAVGAPDTSLHDHWHPECGDDGCYLPHSSIPSTGSVTVFVGPGLPVHRIGDHRVCISEESLVPRTPSITSTTTTATVFCGD